MPTGVIINLGSNVILVTGGSRGIGAACCRILAKAGASVVLNHSHSERGRKAAERVKSDVEAMNKGLLMIEEADVGNYEEVKEMFNHIIARYRKIDTVVYNAGLDEFVNKFGPERFLFGSRFPYEDPESVIMLLTHGNFSIEKAKQIAGDNFRYLLDKVKL